MKIQFALCMRGLAFVLLAAVSLSGPAQNVPAGDAKPGSVQAEYQSSTVLRATTRLVVVDVVALDAKGQAVEDLGIDDFQVLEDSGQQKISSFGFQRGHTVNQTRQSLPANVVSNTPQFSGASSLNVILLDSLNAEYLSRVYGRDQLLKYLQSASSIQPTAVYALENKLRLLHDFTTDTKALLSVLEKYKPDAPTRVVDVYSAASPFSRRGDLSMNSRTLETTISALGMLAQVLASHPGRKNLIWISAAFPLTFYPETFGNATNPIDLKPEDRVAEPSRADMVTQSNMSPSAHGLENEVERVANAMMNAQVAIYPVDSTGLGQNSRANAAGTMRTLSDRTGGLTSINRNDVDLAIRTGMEDGATYYTLEYYPANKVWDGKFRSIQVKTTRPGVQLRYRQGYYAVDPGADNADKKDSDKELARNLGLAMGLDVPSSTGILFEAGVVAPTPKVHEVTVNFAIDSHSLVFERKSDGLYHASLSCAVAAYSEKGALIKKEIISRSAALKEEDFQKVTQGYFPCKRTIDLKPGRYNLTLGVVDHSSHLIGTTTAAVTVP
ncbi:MAG TPA: VWA domain-containing protein [Candidatus Angelobacter sp.]